MHPRLAFNSEIHLSMPLQVLGLKACMATPDLCDILKGGHSLGCLVETAGHSIHQAGMASYLCPLGAALLASLPP